MRRLLICLSFIIVFIVSGCRSVPSIRAVAINGFMLSDTYKREGYHSVRDTQDLGIENLLLRAKSRGYTQCLGLVPITVPASIPAWNASAKKVDTIDGHFFYPDALDWYTKRPLRFFRESFAKADSLGMIFIPSVAGVADAGGAAWSGLHPALDSVRQAPAIVLNSYKGPVDWKGETGYSTPFADDGHDGFDRHFKEYLQRIKLEYDEFIKLGTPKVHPAALPYIFLSYDENYAVARDSLNGGMLPLKDSSGKPCFFPGPYGSTLYTHKVLLLGQDNPFDQRFCDSVCAINGNDIADAIRRLYAYSLWKRARQINEVFGPSTRLIISGMMFDPQFGGATPWQTYHKSADKNNSNEYDHVVLSPGDKSGVLDLPGLDKTQKEFVRQRMILAPWCYSTDKFEGIDPPPPYLGSRGAQVFSRYYDHTLTYRYFKSKGFGFAPMSTLGIPPGDSCFYSSNLDALKNAMLGIMKPEFDGFAQGFIAVFFPCASEGTAQCPPREDTCQTCQRCRCGRLFENRYWYNSKDRYDPGQPKEYFTLEYMADFADGTFPSLAVVKTAALARPHGKSVIRDTSTTIEGALAKAESGDTVVFYGEEKIAGREASRLNGMAAQRGIMLKEKGN
jgi:hypothetical protein